MTKRSFYHMARKAGYPPVHAWNVAETICRWEETDSNLVRIQAEPEERSYFDVYGTPDAYTDIHGRRVSVEQATKEMEETLERDGCWIVIGEYRLTEDSEWIQADSLGMNTGYRDPLSWRENWYVPDIMRATLDALESAQDEALGPSRFESGLVCR